MMFFDQQDSMICIGRHVGRHTLSNMAAKTSFCFILIIYCYTFD